MKLMIDDAVWGFDKIFSEFGKVVPLPGRQISNESLQDCDALIVRSRTRVDEELLRNSKIQFVGSTVALGKYNANRCTTKARYIYPDEAI